MDFFDILLGNLETNLLVFARIIGIFAFNPLLSRRNIPAMVKAGTAVFISVIAVMAVNPEPVVTGEITGVYLLIAVKELLFGLTLGFISNLFFMSIEVSGELMEMQAGLGMAKVFDPITQTQTSLMGTIILFVTYLYFFTVNAHLSYIKLFALSFEILPLADWSFNKDLGWIIAEYFSVVLALVIKISLPIVISELVIQFCIGILMKSVPQIQIMVINIQFKVVLGLIILFIIAQPLAEFIDKYINTLYETLEGAIPLISG